MKKKQYQKKKSLELQLITGVIVFNFAAEMYNKVDVGYIDVVDTCRIWANLFFNKYKSQYNLEFDKHEDFFNWAGYIDKHHSDSASCWDDLIINFVEPLVKNYIGDSTFIRNEVKSSVKTVVGAKETGYILLVNNEIGERDGNDRPILYKTKREAQLEILDMRETYIQEFKDGHRGFEDIDVSHYVAYCERNNDIYEVWYNESRAIKSFTYDAKLKEYIDEEKLQTWEWKLPTSGLYLSFDYGEVQATSIEEARTKIVEEFNENIIKANKSLAYCDNTKDFAIGIEDYDSIEISLKSNNHEEI